MSEVAKLYKYIDYLNKNEIRIVVDYVGKMINRRIKEAPKKRKKIDLSKYQSVGKKFNEDAEQYIEGLRNEW